MNKADQLQQGDINFGDFPESELWEEIKNGNRSAFSFIYSKYVKKLFRYGYFLVSDKDIVEDAIHDIFVKIWMNRNNHITIHCLKSYLYTSLRREVIAKKNNFLKFSRKMDHVDEKAMYQPSAEERWIDHERDEEFIAKMRTFVNNLTERQREIIFLRFYQNLSYEEISDLLHINSNYAYNLTSKAFTQIRKQLS